MNNRLKELRKKNNIKVDEITEKLCISSVYYYDLEKGARRLNEDLLHLFADFYNVSTDYILGRNENENFNSDNVDDYVVIVQDAKSKKISPERLKKLLEFLDDIENNSKK